MKSVVVCAPCKVNLSLDITGVREDGYHLLRSIMQTVDLYDYLLISQGDFPGIFITCDRESLVCDTTNTAYRAAARFFEAAGMDAPSVRIEIVKNIPMQAGLGGGSSDAAAALVGLNALYPRFTQAQLCDIGVQVGADVPFCIRGGTVLCEGVGDIFTDLPALPDCHILIARPKEGISTPNSFKRFDALEKIRRRPDTEQLLATIVSGNLQDIAACMVNVLEEAAKLPQIEQYKQVMLDSGALGAVMTGSGSAVLGIFDSKRAARRAHRRLLPVAKAVFITSPVTQGAVVDSKIL